MKINKRDQILALAFVTLFAGDLLLADQAMTEIRTDQVDLEIRQQLDSRFDRITRELTERDTHKANPSTRQEALTELKPNLISYPLIRNKEIDVLAF